MAASAATSASGWDFCACALAAEGFPDLAVCVHLAEACAHMRACDFDAALRTLQVVPFHTLDIAAMFAVSISFSCIERLHLCFNHSGNRQAGASNNQESADTKESRDRSMAGNIEAIPACLEACDSDKLA